ncbi:MAG: CTP synthase [Candidatus Cloacimonadota bacterium]|nr:CTP synthase [Candidatus Cloacimonadota bacterium]
MNTKYIFITGGVVSSLGKGIASASIGFLLKQLGYKVTIQKFDPYLNVDPGTMSPFQHGEVFVTDDGAETDLDLGHYERFLDQPLSQACNTTAGQVYDTVITNERRGKYLGKTVQTIPHITDEIKMRFKRLSKDSDIIITEIGGTAGDIEGLPFGEAIRQIGLEMDRHDFFCIHLTLIPYISAAGECKTKPTQHSVVKLREIGIQPDMLICRSEKSLSQAALTKISLFTNVPLQNVIVGRDAETIYEIPILFEEQALAKKICNHFQIKYSEIDLSGLKQLVHKAKFPEQTVNVALCGKYVRHQDAYKSVVESLIHAGLKFSGKVNIKYIDTDKLHSHEKIREDTLEKHLKDIHAILVPGGFGLRGIEGKISIIKYAREKNIPFLGICLGMQCAVIEFARNVMGLENANSTEFDAKTLHPVINLMKDQKEVKNKGGTMRLGAYPCNLIAGSQSEKIYEGQHQVSERHRHRYEFNNDFLEKFKEKGMVIGGKYLEKNLVEIIELANHRFFIGTQFHPEFKSRPLKPHPVFAKFIEEAIEYKKENHVL